LKHSKPKTLYSIYLIFFLYGISSAIISPLIPWFSKNLNIGYDKIGLILLFGSIFGIISTFTAGRLCDNLDIKKIIFIGLILTLFGFIIFGFFLSIIFLIITIGFIKLGNGIIDSSGYTYVSYLMQGDHSSAFMRMELFFYIGAIIGPLLISVVLFINLNPRNTFLFFAFSYLIAIILFYILNPWEKNNNFKVKYDDVEDKLKIKSHLFLLKNPIIIITTITLFFFIGALVGLSSWLTTYFIDFNITIYQGSLFLSFYWIALAFGLFLAKKILKKTNEITIILVGSLIGTICIVLFGFINIIFLKVIFLILNGFFISGISSLTISIAASSNPRRPGTIIGFLIAATYFVGIVIQPILGFTAQYIGKRYIFFIVLFCFLINLIFNFVLYWLLKKKNKTKIIFSSIFKRKIRCI
jgi:MFS transporter, FHS family, glucose/mannose:H+ symporter